MTTPITVSNRVSISASDNKEYTRAQNSKIGDQEIKQYIKACQDAYDEWIDSRKEESGMWDENTQLSDKSPSSFHLPLFLNNIVQSVPFLS